MTAPTDNDLETEFTNCATLFNSMHPDDLEVALDAFHQLASTIERYGEVAMMGLAVLGAAAASAPDEATPQDIVNRARDAIGV